MEQSTAIAPPMTFGQRLRFARSRLKLSLRDVEARLDHEVSASALAKWEREESDPGVRRLVAVAELYEVDPMWLIEGLDTSDVRSTTRYAAQLLLPFDDVATVHDIDAERLRRRTERTAEVLSTHTRLRLA